MKHENWTSYQQPIESYYMPLVFFFILDKQYLVCTQKLKVCTPRYWLGLLLYGLRVGDARVQGLPETTIPRYRKIGKYARVPRSECPRATGPAHDL